MMCVSSTRTRKDFHTQMLICMCVCVRVCVSCLLYTSHCKVEVYWIVKTSGSNTALLKQQVQQMRKHISKHKKTLLFSS